MIALRMGIFRELTDVAILEGTLCFARGETPLSGVVPRDNTYAWECACAVPAPHSGRTPGACSSCGSYPDDDLVHDVDLVLARSLPRAPAQAQLQV